MTNNSINRNEERKRQDLLIRKWKKKIIDTKKEMIDKILKL